MKKPVVIVLVVVLVVAAGAGAYFYIKDKNKTTTTTSNTQPMEGMNHSDDHTGENSSAPSTPAATETVAIKDFAFGPKSITVKKGTAVTWTNEDTAEHSVVSDAGAPENVDSSLLAKGESFTHVFVTTGTYKYHCGPHPNMTATVTVTE